MTKFMIALTLTILPMLAVADTASQKMQDELAAVGVQRFTATDYKPGLIRHIVLFRYHKNVTATQKEKIKHDFLALKDSIREGHSYVVAIETGAQNSGEGVDQDLEQGFVVTFRSEGDRNYYVRKISG